VLVPFDDRPFLLPAEDFLCRRCGYGLVPEEALPANEGGELMAGWWFTCEACGRDTFLDAGVPRWRSDAPPAVGMCRACGRAHTLRPEGGEVRPGWPPDRAAQ
jgi:hypothetical protein